MKRSRLQVHLKGYPRLFKDGRHVRGRRVGFLERIALILPKIYFDFADFLTPPEARNFLKYRVI